MSTPVENGDSIRIQILNKWHAVPREATIMQAIEYAGHQFIRGCGCRGGVCGACSVVYRMPDSFEIKTGLACQTKVMENMQLMQLPYFPVNKATYELDELVASGDQVMALYPEISNCMGCNTCTKSCPMEINVMGAMSEILKGNIEEVSRMTIGCTMCGLCAGRCPVGLTPFLYSLLCRRLDGRHIKVPFIDVGARVEQIERGDFNEEMDKLVALEMKELEGIYKEAQKDKRII